MGDSHYKSDLIGKNGTETISNFASISGTGFNASSYVKVGTKYILTTTFNTAASINIAATALVGTCPAGSMALGVGVLWVFASDNVATKATLP